MVRPTEQDIISAWFSVADEWIARKNKTYSDGFMFEVIHDWGGDIIADETQELLKRFATQDEATLYAHMCENKARARAVLKLFDGRASALGRS